MAKLRYCTFNTEMGWMGALSGANGLRVVTLPRRSENDARKALGNQLEQAELSLEIFTDLVSRLKGYFNGQEVPFPDKLDFTGGTPFQVSVWQTTGRIPYRETRSYAWVAEQLGKPRAARAVGQAMGRNPLPIIIPCHRVVARNGGLGGFGGGLEMKKQLLRMEKKVY